MDNLESFFDRTDVWKKSIANVKKTVGFGKNQFRLPFARMLDRNKNPCRNRRKKLRSYMTLFCEATPQEERFRKVLKKIFDRKTKV